jgi:hypothetical protein
MSGSDEPFPRSSHDPSPSHPAGSAIGRGSLVPYAPRRRLCVKCLNIGIALYFLMAATDRLDSTALQTVGEKGWDGFSISIVKA